MLRASGAVVAFALLTALPAGSVAAGDEREGSTEVEFAVAEGSGAGFGCGQQTRVHYVKAAGEVRHTARGPGGPRGRGLTVLAGAAVEGSRATPVEAPDEDGFIPGRDFGESWLESRFGGHLRVGYWTPYFGVEAGGLVVVFPDSSFSTYALPEGEAWVGRRDLLYFLGGAGVPQLTAQLGFADLYFGLGCVPARGLELETRWSRQIGGPVYGDRVDVIWRVRMNRRWAFRGGLALGEFDGHPSLSREASIGLQLTP